MPIEPVEPIRPAKPVDRKRPAEPLESKAGERKQPEKPVEPAVEGYDLSNISSAQAGTLLEQPLMDDTEALKNSMFRDVKAALERKRDEKSPEKGDKTTLRMTDQIVGRLTESDYSTRLRMHRRASAEGTEPPANASVPLVKITQFNEAAAQMSPKLVRHA